MNGFSYKVLFIIATLIVSGCATHIPPPISTLPATNLSVAEARSDMERYKGSEVRWGGAITRVENRASETWIEVVAHDLHKDGEPISDSQSSGRFIASFEGFVDPLVYSSGRLLTVVGTLADTTTRKIGEYDYTFPVVKVTTFYLWPVDIDVQQQQLYPDYPPPWWYYNPWPIYPRPFPYHPYYR